MRQAVDDLNLPQQICPALEDSMYCFAVLGDMTSGTIYTALCGQFPITSFRGMKYICVAYVYKCNSILMRPMKGQDILDARQAVDDLNPPQQLCTALEDCMYCFAVLGDMTSGTIYTDLCGQFPSHHFEV